MSDFDSSLSAIVSIYVAGIIGCGILSARRTCQPTRSTASEYRRVRHFTFPPQAAAEQFGIAPFTPRRSAAADPAVEIVDIATFPEQRIPIMRSAPLASISWHKAATDLEQARRSYEAEQPPEGCRQPEWSLGLPWRIATLIQQELSAT
jgi:hypothetical protein